MSSFALIPSIVINVATVAFALFAWLYMVLGLGKGGQDLATRGWESLKYFTVLSNLFNAVVCAIYAVYCCAVGALPTWLVVLKLLAATSVMLTFTTVVTILRPRYGLKSMFAGGNLWLHLILPLLAAVDVCLFVPLGGVPVWMTVFGIVPTMLYGAGYLLAIARHGAEDNGKVYDFYGFLRWGYGKIPVVCAAMLAASWGLSLLLYGVNHLCHPSLVGL